MHATNTSRAEGAASPAPTAPALPSLQACPKSLHYYFSTVVSVSERSADRSFEMPTKDKTKSSSGGKESKSKEKKDAGGGDKVKKDKKDKTSSGMRGQLRPVCMRMHRGVAAAAPSPAPSPPPSAGGAQTGRCVRGVLRGRSSADMVLMRAWHSFGARATAGRLLPRLRPPPPLAAAGLTRPCRTMVEHR